MAAEGPRSEGDLEDLANFVAGWEPMHLHRSSVVADLVLLATACASMIHPAPAWVAATTIGWVCVGMVRQSRNGATLARTTLLEEPTLAAELTELGINGPRFISEARNFCSGSLLALGAAGILLLSVSSTWFTVAVGARAAHTLIYGQLRRRQAETARTLLDQCVNTLPWARRWGAQRAQRVEDADQFLRAHAPPRRRG